MLRIITNSEEAPDSPVSGKGEPDKLFMVSEGLYISSKRI